MISPDSRRAYMTNFNDGAAGTLSIYDLSRTPRAIATIPTGGEGTAGAAISADGQILYVAHMTSGDVTAFRIGNDRTPTRLGSWSADRARSSWHCRTASAVGDKRRFERYRAVSSSGRRSTCACRGTDSGWRRRSEGIVVAPDGRSLYVTLYADGDGPGAVAAFRVGRSGTLEALGQPVPTGGNGAEAIALTRDGRRLLVANFNKGDQEGA